MKQVIGPLLRATSLVRQFRASSQLRLISTHAITSPHHSKASRSTNSSHSNGNALKSLDYQYPGHAVSQLPGKSAGAVPRPQIGENVSPRDKIKFLVSTLIDLEDNKEAIYSALDAWVAWERDFPIGRLKVVLLNLEKEQQWHRIIQVIKWMLSKGQGNTMNTYGQLIQALDMDHRAKEAHELWMKKIGSDLHAVPWKLCKLMISVYYRNDMLQDLVKLFKGLEAFDRKPPEKSIVQKVANAYEILGLIEEKERILEKYKELFVETRRGRPKNSSSPRSEKKKQKKEKKKSWGKEVDKVSQSPDNHSSVSETGM